MNANTLLSHEHGLVLRELSENCSFSCDFCSFPVNGPTPAYHCLECELVLHELCAKLPPQIQHPSHPEHSLIFTGIHCCFSHDRRCCGCDRPLFAGGTYECHGCNLAWHVGCVAATLPPPQDEPKHKEEKIHHFAHEHPLTTIHVNVPTEINCKACQEKMSGLAYGCRGCVFMLHESCALLPREIQHPFHPQHQLTLLSDFETTFRCKVCERYCQFAYNCNECDFNLDVKCAVSITDPSQDDQYSIDNRREIHHFSHPHQLTCLHAKTKVGITCKVCQEEISGDSCEFYCCPDCLFMLHVLCAKLPQEIAHPLHPDHPLICQANFQECSLCSCNYGFGFKCEECRFGLHVVCALQSLSALKEEVYINIQHIHEHPMRLQCNKIDQKLCNVCEEPLHGLAYVCQGGCHIVIHKACAELPRDSEHPFHPQHPVVLLSEPFNRSGPCIACLKRCYGFTFYCGHCEIQFHVYCAMRRPTLKHQRHEHSVTYFNQMGRVQCSLCYDDCSIDLYRCVPCNYNLHHGCMPLPSSIKHELHIHPMVLRDRVVDDFYDEQYCDLCETIRHPEHGVYYCDECRCAAHIDCVVIPKVEPEQRKLLEDLMLVKLDEEIASVEVETEALKKKTEMSMKNLEELKKKRQEIMSSRMQEEAKLKWA
ncbi:uncharacterized protein LOC116190316 [Punica granatum]|uniref:Uncharacterized protein LOC116190316 n=1 Tax=Punica granatum TaxID=22663 RepID=A0A6P8BXS9_PUNGR|nr:uncharacterized protein LOC116190316 [Punica granatum]